MENLDWIAILQNFGLYLAGLVTAIIGGKFAKK